MGHALPKFFRILFVIVCVVGLSAADGVKVGSREWKAVRGARKRAANTTAVDVQGLEILKSYVCPSPTNHAKRQISVISGSTTVSIPTADLQLLFTELTNVLAQIQKILSDLGVAVPTLSTLPNSPVITTSGSTTILAIPAISTLPGASASGKAAGAATTQAPTSTWNVGKPLSGSSPPASQTISPQVTTPQIVGSNPTLSAAKPPSNPASTSTDDGMCWDDTPSTAAANAPPTTQANAAAQSTTKAPNVAAQGTANGVGGAFVQSTASASAYGASPTGSVSGYTFNAQSNENVAVYFGQTPVTSGSSLVAQCADPNIDIVILAFVIQNNYQSSGYPLLNFGAACGGQSTQMQATAPGLLQCNDLQGMIATCQATYGKKVMMSIGGAASSISFSTSQSATDFGNVLWKLFGPSGNIDPGLRPFGTVVLDGFDIDNENNQPTYWDVLGSTLRNNFATDKTKTFYLSSAPQCPMPDASNPSGLLLNTDFVFVQFYNNPPCEIGSTGFTASVSAWSQYLGTSTLSTKPRLYVGAPAWSAAGPSAYAHIGDAQGMEAVAKSVKQSNLANFGGVMFWDGPEGMLNLDDGKDIIAWAKTGLTS